MTGPCASAAGLHYVGRAAFVALLAVSVVMAPTAQAARRTVGAATALRQMSRADLEAAKVVGTGCFWSLRGNRGTRLAMVGDRAAIKTGDGIVILTGTSGAKEMFPFTHDHWASADGRIRIAVRQSSELIAVGEEAVTTGGIVELGIAGKHRTMRGLLQCGS